jgi:2,4-dienoyl-CoA reductase-like NADH-dependent reductase (Old Yellow Enzyme family)/thioredoxin reductase
MVTDVREELKPLFEPFTVGGVKIKNKLVMAPMAGAPVALDGSISQQSIAYWVTVARGGVGMMFVAPHGVDPPLSGGGFIHHDAYIPGLRKLTDAVHEQGAKIGVQLYHAGRYYFIPGTSIQPVAPSAVPSRLPAPPPRALTTEECEALIEKYAQCAERAIKAGFDGVDVLAGQGYLLSTFLSPLTNKRTDRFGGETPEERATILVEIIRRIKERIGDKPILCVKLSVDDFMPGGTTVEDTKRIVPLLVDAGANMFNAWAAWHEAPVSTTIASVPRDAFVYLAEAVKGVAKGAAVGAVNRINDPRLAARIIAGKRADFVIIGRALRADPEFPRKAEEGKVEDIRMCIACNRCLDEPFGSFMGIMLESHPGLTCSVNAGLGREWENRTAPTDRPKKVLIVGGGPAGMEVARVAALRGHKVSLWEAKDRLGGALIPASAAPYKDEIPNLTAYLTAQIRKLGVKVELNKEATAETIVEAGADEVILATGGVPIVPEIPGIEKDNVVTAVDVLTGKKEVGEKVAIIGGGLVGCETAEYLASVGKKVTLVEMLPAIARDVGITNRRALRTRVLAAGVEVLTSTEAKAVTDRGVMVEAGGQVRTVEADSVVLAVGFKPNTKLWEALKDRVSGLHLIGDAARPSKLLEAIRAGWNVACEI